MRMPSFTAGSCQFLQGECKYHRAKKLLIHVECHCTALVAFEGLGAVFQKTQEVLWMATQVREQLMASHEEFRRLAQEHTQYAQRLDSLIQKRFLNEDEKLEEVRLKKLKLRLKDQMELLEQHYRQQNNVA